MLCLHVRECRHLRTSAIAFKEPPTWPLSLAKTLPVLIAVSMSSNSSGSRRCATKRQCSSMISAGHRPQCDAGPTGVRHYDWNAMLASRSSARTRHRQVFSAGRSTDAAGQGPCGHALDAGACRVVRRSCRRALGSRAPQPGVLDRLTAGRRCSSDGSICARHRDRPSSGHAKVGCARSKRAGNNTRSSAIYRWSWERTYAKVKASNSMSFVSVTW